MNFASDNWSGATPAVMAAIARHNDGFAPAYGGDAATAKMERRFSELFETETEVWCVGSGTAANALSMAAAARPGGLILCSENAHLYHDELGAAEFFTGGMKLVPVPARHGLVSAEALAETLARFPSGNRTGRPTILSLTEASELGTVYHPNDIRAIAEIAHAAGMVVHMDGARFANAVAALGATPAALSWQAGIDIMSFGATKNGCWAADAVIVFTPDRIGDLGTLRQRSGHTASKSRFMAAQFEGYLEDGNWLRTAAHANAMAQRLAAGITASDSARVAWAPQANEVFAVLPETTVARLRTAGATFHEWPADDVELAAGEALVRLVTSWATVGEEVEQFAELL